MKNKIRVYFLPLNRNIIFLIVLFIIFVSLSIINFTASERIESVVYSPQSNIYYQGNNKQKAVSFKINVAWGQEYLPEILDILAANDIKTTFFFVGNWVEKFPDKLREIKKAGHEIGNHGYRHQHPTQLDKNDLIRLIKKNEELIYQESNYKTELFAPPYGEVNDEVVEIASSLGYKTIMWTKDTIDWQRPAPEVIIRRATDNLEQGSIILMHPTEPTAEALAEIIKIIKEKNYDIIPISQIIED